MRYSVGLFVFALIFSVMALNRLEDRVSELVTFLTGLLGIATVMVFLFLIDYAARLLRPVSDPGEGRRRRPRTSFDTVYPDLTAAMATMASELG